MRGATDRISGSADALSEPIQFSQRFIWKLTLTSGWI
jgi:hypothetical protein